jgi:gas vesicle protein GvpG
MGILSAIVLWPLAPIKGVIALGEVLQRQAEDELHNPANTRRQLEELEEARERGEISADEEKEVQQRILETRLAPKGPSTAEPEGG